MKNIKKSIKVLGSVVRVERKKRKLTQKELGEYAKTGINFVYDLERGKAGLRFDKVLDVIKVLGLQLKIEYGKNEIVE